MKQLLLFITFFFSFQFAFTQVFDVQTIKSSGDDDKRINLVIMGDGYTAGELTQFEADATAFMNAMFVQTPYAEYENYFNVYIIKVISNESGASHPGTAGDEPVPIEEPVISVDNFFGTAYDSFGIHRLLYTPNDALVISVLADNFPLYDQAMILVNAPYYGGSGGEFPVASTGPFGNEIAIHEIGHSLVDLKDEYYPGDALSDEAINMTLDNNPATIKWKNWLGTNGIGIYPFTDCPTLECDDWYRPHQNCKMFVLGQDFCAVCSEGTIEEIHSRVSAIDSYTPTGSTISSPTFPLDFQLNLVHTIPNTLESTWTLNSSTFATNMDAIMVEEDDAIPGNNNLTVVVHDNASLLDVDNHATTHFYTVSWTIDNTLGIQDVEANDYSISMYPNPSNNIINIAMENTLGKDVVVEIVSMDGKKIKSENISHNQNAQIDISTLSQGLYIANFYANDVLMSSKKLVKN